MHEILLTRGMVALVDDDDVEIVAGYRWQARPNAWGDDLWYAQRHGAAGTVYMHREVAGLGKGGPHVDHVNGNGLDNRRANLRLATPSQNHANRGKQRGTYSSAFKGVCWDKSRGKWMAVLQLMGHHKHLGRFINEEDAARAYDAAALETWGEFARVNFPEQQAA